MAGREKRARAVVSSLAGLVVLMATTLAQAAGPLVAAASDLEHALREVAGAFAHTGAEPPRLVFSSSGNLSRQIEGGAPFELFLSADERYIEQLHARGLVPDTGVLYAIGRIVLLIPHGSRLAPDATLADLGRSIDDGRLRHLAIANPETAPYGRAAREVLQHAGLWPRIERRLVIGENVAQATQFALSGNADGGIVAHSLALAADVEARATAVLLPADWHAPLRQRMALTARAGARARAFYTFLQSAAAHRILERYGFTIPSP